MACELICVCTVTVDSIHALISGEWVVKKPFFLVKINEQPIDFDTSPDFLSKKSSIKVHLT